MLYPQNGDRIVTTDSVTSLHLCIQWKVKLGLVLAAVDRRALPIESPGYAHGAGLCTAKCGRILCRIRRLTSMLVDVGPSTDAWPLRRRTYGYLPSRRAD